MHLIFFISMLLINTDIEVQLHPEAESHLDERSIYEDQILSGGHGAHGHHAPMTTK